MHHDTPLLTTLVLGLGLAYLFGMLAHRFKMPPLVGYLVAGIAVGPFTPGLMANQELATELAEIGVILLMFGVGLHFSIKDLLSVKKIAIPGAIVQISIATLMGMGLAHLMGWPWGQGLVFGLALSVASTVVLLRALEDRGILDSLNGRIAVGWLVVEDLVTVLVLVASGIIKLYDLVVAQTSGGPGTASQVPAMYVYSYMFQAQNLGQGFAASTMMLLSVLIVLIPWAYLEFGGKRHG